MLSQNNKKHAKIMRFSVIFIAMVCTGLLYCCNFKTDTDNLQLQSLESDEGRMAVADMTIDKPIDKSADTNVDTTLAGSSDLKKEASSKDPEIYVYVCGCVTSPGVYGSYENTRIYQVIDMAGGMTAEADQDYLNMAEFIKDGQKIYVPSVSEKLSAQTGITGGAQASGMVNINTAAKEQLMTLPGIGESRADDIISYRSSNGLFKTIEDIKNVSGIKEAAFGKIKDLIVVK